VQGEGGGRVQGEGGGRVQGEGGGQVQGEGGGRVQGEGGEWTRRRRRRRQGARVLAVQRTTRMPPEALCGAQAVQRPGWLASAAAF
jgi:hypothetical protein